MEQVSDIVVGDTVGSTSYVLGTLAIVLAQLAWGYLPIAVCSHTEGLFGAIFTQDAHLILVP